VMASSVSLGLSAWILLATLPWLVAAIQRIGVINYPQPREATSLLFIVCNCLVAGSALLAGLKTRKALRRPGIGACFR
jgi:hypothetical protein